jgi:hypothetical protein
MSRDLRISIAANVVMYAIGAVVLWHVLITWAPK